MIWILWAFFALVLLFGFVVFRGAPYVPSHRRFVKLAFTDLYSLSEKDVVVDLGSGDGIVLRLAANKAKKAIGYELNPALVLISRILAKGNPKIETRLGDMWLADLPIETTVIYAFAVTRDVAKLERKVQQAVNKWGHTVWLITYGSGLETKEPVRTLYAHSMYVFAPEK